jgi:hypothetical protein
MEPKDVGTQIEDYILEWRGAGTFVAVIVRIRLRGREYAPEAARFQPEPAFQRERGDLGVPRDKLAMRKGDSLGAKLEFQPDGVVAEHAVEPGRVFGLCKIRQPAVPLPAAPMVSAIGGQQGVAKR